MSKSFYSNILSSGLTFHSQPIVALNDKRVVGHELLARLKVGEGYVPPHEFIPDIEREGLYDVLDQRLAEYVSRYLDFTDDSMFVSINIPSSASLHFQTTNPKIKGRSHRVHFELLESVEWSNASNIDAVNNSFDRGFKIFLDDFGSGKSNLQTLLYPSVSGVKIDRCMLLKFIQEERHDSLAHLVDMICSLDKQIVFEGIEAIEQERFLSKMHTSAYAQGFLYGKPDILGYE